MSLAQQIAKHFREVHTGGNWTASNLRDNLANVDWQQATTQVHNLNTIAALVYHMNYYVSAVLKVLQGGPLDAHDKFSFELPMISSREDWEKLRDKTLMDAETLAGLVEELPESRFWEDFTDKKYGSYYRNLHGVIEHIHYHLGQVALVKKILQDNGEN